MKTFLTQTDSGWLLCSDEVVEGSKLHLSSKGIFVSSDITYFEEGETYYLNHKVHSFPCHKIIAAEDIEGLPKIQFANQDDADRVGFVDVENLADLYVKGQPLRNRNISNDGWNATGFVNGFKAAQQLNKNKYSEEDLKEAIEKARDYYICNCALGEHPEYNYSEDEIIKSLVKTQWEVEIQKHDKYVQIIKIISPFSIQ